MRLEAELDDTPAGATCGPEASDLLLRRSSLWVWGIPVAALAVATAAVNAGWLSGGATGVVDVVATLWFGAGCAYNARGCGRAHCRIDAVALPLLAVVGVLDLAGVVSFGWNAYVVTFAVVLALSFVPELLGYRYLARPRSG